MKIVREHINEKFVEDSDPVDDLIGTRKQISKWLKENGEEDTDDNAFIECARRGKTEWVKYLIRSGVDVHKWNYGALRLAYINEHKDVIDIILDTITMSFTDNEKILRYCVKNDWQGILKILQEHIAKEKKAKKIKESLNEKFIEDSDPVKDLGLGTRKQISKFMKELNKKDTDDNALAECAKYGKTEWVKFLIARGANVHAMDDWALHWAATYGHVETVKVLLDAGADVHAIDDYALRWAAENGHTETVQVLLDAGADVHAINDYALRWAAENGHTEIVQVLQDHIAKEKEAKKVKESLNEKFVEDSDPVKDLGIGVDAVEEAHKFFDSTRGMLGHVNVMYNDDGHLLAVASTVLRFFKYVLHGYNVQEAFYKACRDYNFDRDNAFCIKYRKYMADKINERHKLKIDPLHPNFYKEKED